MALQIERKALPLEIKEMDAEAGTFEGLASSFGDEMGPGDSYGDVVRVGAYKRCLEEHKASGKPFKMLWQHDWDDPIGKYMPTEVQETAAGLWVKGRFTLGVRKADEARLLMADGALDGLSIGYYPRKAEPPPPGSAAWRILTDIELLEISPVTFPADAATYIAGVKAGQGPDPLTQIVGKLLEAEAAVKAGKVFSAENEAQLRKAHEVLSALLAKVEAAPAASEAEAAKAAEFSHQLHVLKLAATAAFALTQV